MGNGVAGHISRSQHYSNTRRVHEQQRSYNHNVLKKELNQRRKVDLQKNKLQMKADINGSKHSPMGIKLNTVEANLQLICVARMLFLTSSS